VVNNFIVNLNNFLVYEKVLLFAALVSSNFVFAQLLTFSFDAATGTNSVPRASSSNAVGIQPSTISAGAGVTVNSATGIFSGESFATTATFSTDYLEFAITPTAGYSFSLTSISAILSASNTLSLVIRTSLDNYATNATNVVMPTVTATSYQFLFAPASTYANLTSAITIRIYGFNAQNGNTDLFIGTTTSTGPDISVTGTLIVLPVKFANIKASKKGNGIEVSFANLTESNVVNYSIERSANGQQYSSIKELAPSKNNGGSADYSFTDVQPLSGNNLYRIKSTETNGKVSYSAVARVDLEAKGLALTIAPNPVKSPELGLQITNLPAGSYKIRIFNNNAQVVGEQLLKHTGGSFSQTLPLNKLQAGMYYLELNGAVKLQKQFIVQ